MTTELTVQKLLANLSLPVTMHIINDLAGYADHDETSQAIARAVADDLMYRFEHDFVRASDFAKGYGVTLTYSLQKTDA